MIKRLTTEEEVAELIGIDDENIEDIFGCTKGEWIQWLVSQATNENLFILASYKDDFISDYIVVSNTVCPPLTDSISILYVYSKLGKTKHEEVLKEIVKWGISLGAKRIIMQTKTPILFYRYGFEETDTLMELKI